MKLKDNKGYVGIDISISLIVLIILVPAIMAIVFTISSTRLTTKLKTEASNIAVNVVESAKGIDLDQLTKTSEEASNAEVIAAVLTELENIYGTRKYNW